MRQTHPTGLKPCPNRLCVSQRTGRDRVERVHAGIVAYWVRCAACCLEGPTADNEPQADLLWNYLPRLEGQETPDAKASVGARL